MEPTKLQIAKEIFRALEARDTHPTGFFDGENWQWYPDSNELEVCCCAVPLPSPEKPHTLLMHCRTAEHVAQKYNVALEDLLSDPPLSSRRYFTRKSYDIHGFNTLGIHRRTHSAFSPAGYDREGYDREGFGKDGIHRETGTKYALDGFNKGGIHRDTGTEYDPRGFNSHGWNSDGFNREGWDIHGFNSEGTHRETGTPYNCEGYDREGYDREGYDFLGLTRDGCFRTGEYIGTYPGDHFPATHASDPQCYALLESKALVHSSVS